MCTFTDCIREMHNTQIDNAKYIDVVMQMYNSIEYSNNYSKTSGNLWQYYRDDKPALNAVGTDIDFPAGKNNSILFEFKIKLARKTGKDGTNIAKIIVSLKYLSNFCTNFEVPLINSKTWLILKLILF